MSNAGADETCCGWHHKVLKQLAMQRESRIEEGHLLRDHVYMLVSIPPKGSASNWRTQCYQGEVFSEASL